MKRLVRGLAPLLAAGLLGTMLHSASAQASGDGTSDNRAGKQTGGGQTTGGAGQADPNSSQNGTAAGNSAGSSTGGILTTAEFNFTQTIANMNEVEYEASKLAVGQAVSDSVRQYARRVQDDHDVNSARLQTFLDARRLLPPRQIDPKDAAKLTILSKYTDRNFDAAYRKFTVSSHNQMVTLLKNEIKSGKDADLKAYAESTLAMAQSHLKLARNLNSKAPATRTTQTRGGA